MKYLRGLILLASFGLGLWMLCGGGDKLRLQAEAHPQENVTQPPNQVAPPAANPVVEGLKKIENAPPKQLEEITRDGLTLALKWWGSVDGNGERRSEKLYLLIVKAEPRFSDPYEYHFASGDTTDTLQIYEYINKNDGLALRYEISGYFNCLKGFISTPPADGSSDWASNVLIGFDCSGATANVYYFALTRRGESLECIWTAILKYEPEFVRIDDDELKEIVAIADGIFYRQGSFSDPDSVLEEQPRDADIYRWNGKYFDIWKSVKWKDRLKVKPQRDR